MPGSRSVVDDRERVDSLGRKTNIQNPCRSVLVRICAGVTLENGDICKPSNWVLVRTSGQPTLARVKEILDVLATGSAAERQILLLHCSAAPSQLSTVYQMPRIPQRSMWMAVGRARMIESLGWWGLVRRGREDDRIWNRPHFSLAG